MSETSPRRSGELLRAIFEILEAHTDGLPVAEVMTLLEQKVTLTPFEQSSYPKNPEVRRFDRIPRFMTIAPVKAGWLTKQGGKWELTDRGRAAYEQFRDPQALMQEANRLYRVWRGQRSDSASSSSSKAPQVRQVTPSKASNFEGQPTGRIFYPTSEKLKFLLASIHNREVALPDFQRDFVWDPRATEELIESICQNFPAGSLLRIKNSAGFFFAPREFAGAPPLNDHEPSYLILDGQQRLTSLYQAFYGAGAHRYFIDVGALIEGADLEDSVFYLRRQVGESRFGTIEKQAASLVFPLSILFGARGGFDEWLDRVVDERPDDQALLKPPLRELKKSVLRTVEDYEFPMVSLADSTSPSAVCTIFETLNRTGVKLSVYDLLTARFWPENLHLRDLWEQAQSKYPIISEFEVDPYYVLQGVALFTAKAAPTCKRTDVLSLAVDQIEGGWWPVVEGLAETLNILREDCGVILPDWLPYQTILIPAAAVMARVAEMKGPDRGAGRLKLKRWFWCSVFGQAYENAPNSQAAKDLTELRAWLGGGRPPETVNNFSFNPGMLRLVTPRQRAVYRGVIALVLRHGARDFHGGGQMTSAMIRDKGIDDHHVFPQAFLSETRPDITNALRDCVLNRTLIDRETNIRIGKRAPSDYLTEIEQAIGRSEIDLVLRSHLLPDSLDSSLRRDDFEGFLQAREELIRAELSAVTHHPG